MKRKKAIQVLSRIDLCDEVIMAGWCSYYKDEACNGCPCWASQEEKRAAVRKAIDALKEKKS